MFLLLTYWIIAGVTAKDISEVHYQARNSSLCLHVTNPLPEIYSQWTIKETIIVSGDEINPNLTNKVIYNPKDRSLCIKDLTDDDNGIYEFTFSHAFKKIYEKHTIIVQEIVPRPVILMSVLNSNVSSGVCNISVNCTIHKDWLCAYCEADYCTTSQKSLSRVNITIFTDNRTVVCSVSNIVSTNNASKSLTAACFSKSVGEHKKELLPPFVILIGVLVCLFLFVIMIVVTNKLLSKKQDQTSTAHLIRNQQVEAQNQPGSRGSTSSSSQPDAAYENVVPTPSAQGSGSGEERGSAQGPKVDTVYSVLQPTKASLQQGRRDNSKPTATPQRTPEASQTSQSVGRDEPEQPGHIDTVYSMLQKPKHPQPQQQQ